MIAHNLDTTATLDPLKDRADTALDWLRQWADDPRDRDFREIWQQHGHELVDQLASYIEALELLKS